MAKQDTAMHAVAIRPGIGFANNGSGTLIRLDLSKAEKAREAVEF